MWFGQQDNPEQCISFQTPLRWLAAQDPRPLASAGTHGFSKATLIVVDEAARVEDSLMASLRPMLATSVDGGKAGHAEHPRRSAAILSGLVQRLR